MEPKTLLLAQGSQCRKIVNSTIIDGSRAPDHTKWIQADGAIPRNLYLELGRMNAEIGIDFDFP
jgi:hypothetical protein